MSEEESNRPGEGWPRHALQDVHHARAVLSSGSRQGLDEHLNNLVNRLLLAVAQGGVLTHFDHAHTSIAEKHPKELGSLFQGKSVCMREIRSRQIAAPEHIDI